MGSGPLLTMCLLIKITLRWNVFDILFTIPMSLADKRSSFKRQISLNDPVTLKMHRKSIVDQGLQSANWEEALKNKERESNQTHNGNTISYFVSNEHFKQYGPGTYLFFMFADKLLKVLVIMSLLIIPVLYSNYSGDGMASIGSSGMQSYLMEFSFGNQLTNSTYYSNKAYLAQMNSRYYLVIIPDFVYSLVFLVFLLYWEHRSSQIVKQMKKETELPSYFCVTVENLPESIDSEQVQQYMSQFGSIKEIAQVRNYDQAISISRKIYEKAILLKEQRLRPTDDKSEGRLAKIKQDIDDDYLILNKHFLAGDVLMYFVSFASISERDEVVKRMASLQKLKYNSALCCGCHSDAITSNYLIGQLVPTVKPCTVQPGSIIWENIHLSKYSRLTRWVLQSVFIILASLFGFFLLSFINIATPQQVSNNIDTSGYTFEQVLAGYNATVIKSWCLSQNPTTVYFGSDALMNLCSSYLNSYYSFLGLTIAISIGVVAIKIVLERVVYYISRFQRPSSHNQQTASLTINYFLIYFITTFILTILLQAELWGISFKYITATILSNPYLISNLNSLDSFSDFTRKWYNQIGYKICITWIISSLVPHIYDPLIQWLLEKINHYRAQKQLIQRTMNEMIRPMQFAFEQHYANLLLIIFGAMTLGGPIPFLIIFATLALATKLMYWRIMFIRFSRIPPTFDESLNNNVLKILPWALVIHCAISIYAYGADNIFPSGLSPGVNLSHSIILNLSVQDQSSFKNIILNRVNVSFLVFVSGCLIFAVTIAKLFFYDTLIYLISYFSKDEEVLVSVKSLEAEDKDKSFIRSYMIEKNHNYQEILAIVKAIEPPNENIQV